MCDEKSEDDVTACSCGASTAERGQKPARVVRKIPLVRGLPRKRLFRTIHYHLRSGDASRRASAFYLVDLEERREYKAASCASAVQFAERAGHSLDQAQELLRVGRALENLPVLDEAFNRGEIGWSKLRRIARAAVRGMRHGESPPAGDGLGTRRVTFRIQYNVSAAVNALWQTALEKAMGELGEGATVEDALKLLAEVMLGKDPEGNVPGRRDRAEPVYTVVYHVGSDGRSAWVEGEEGRVPIPLGTALEAAGTGRVIEVPDLEDPGDTEAIRFGERGSVPPGERDHQATDSVRRAVFAREGHRCAGCTGRKALRAHHLKSLANGGQTEVEYLVGVCDTCHGLCHEGLIRFEVDENGRLIVKDAEERPLREEQLSSEALGSEDAPLVLIERVLAESAESENRARARSEASQVVVAPCSLPESCAHIDAVDLSHVESIDELPDLLTALEWRPSRRALSQIASRFATERQLGTAIASPPPPSAAPP